MKQDRSPSQGLFTIGIAALFLAGFFLLVVFGAGSYRSTVAARDGNMQSRAVLSYLFTAVRGHDTAGAVFVGEGPEGGSLLILADGDSGYALRIYLHDGTLVEDYAAAGAPLQPAQAQSIGSSGIFLAELSPARTLRLTTDAGEILLRLRSGGEAA